MKILGGPYTTKRYGYGKGGVYANGALLLSSSALPFSEAEMLADALSEREALILALTSLVGPGPFKAEKIDDGDWAVANGRGSWTDCGLSERRAHEAADALNKIPALAPTTPRTKP